MDLVIQDYRGYANKYVTDSNGLVLGYIESVTMRQENPMYDLSTTTVVLKLDNTAVREAKYRNELRETVNTVLAEPPKWSNKETRKIKV